MGAKPPIIYKSQFFNVKIELDEIYPDVWGIPINFDIPKLNIRVNIGIRIQVKLFFFSINREFTLCLR